MSAFCEKLIEAGWLAAIIMAPLFFNVYSSRTFEPDKTSLIRTLALVMVAAWLVIRAERLRAGTAERARIEGPAVPAGAQLRGLADRWSRSNPLILPTLGLAAVYLISTIASVSPGISLLGSYTRMQGTLATFSYIVIFLLTASTMRTRAQVERAITTALVTSFPVAFYGMIQHYFLDPLPWIGDVTTRVASNMGNSIFVGAYLITVIPLAIARVAGHTARLSGELGRRGRIGLYGGIVLSLLAFAAAWGLAFELGAKTLIEGKFQGTLTPEMLKASDANFMAALIVTAAVVLAWWLAGLLLAKKRPGLFLLIGIYSFLLALQTLTLLFTQSRGPLLGFLAGLFTLALLYALVRGARQLALATMSAAAVGLLLLVLFNVAADTSMAGLRNIPYIGRLGQVFQTEEGTGKVRVLIWQGALQLVLPHSPLWSPTTGSDILNPIRPLIGYGPETIYIAYNPFYPPELGHIESRTATPDRSHNETFDALVTTGVIGWIAENILFLSVLYFGLKWLALVNSARERNILIALWYSGGLVMTLLLGLTIGWHFLGVALPAGM
ncbi:MAG: O-antigen ligase family protein, partial [Rudaea sp.]